MNFLAKRPFIVLFILIFSISLLLEFLFQLENGVLRAVIAASVAVLLSPRKRRIQTQTGKKTQITWIFLKKPIFLES